MRQMALVTEIMSDNQAIISVKRQSACGDNCSGCGGCGITDRMITARAENKAGASLGDSVMVEISAKRIFGIISVVYVIPILLFVLMGIVSTVIGYSEEVTVLLSFMGLVVGIVILMIFNYIFSRKKEISYTIVEVVKK